MPSPDHGTFRFLGERVRYAGSFIKLVTATFLDPAGYTFERDLIRHTGAVCVVAIEDDGSVIMLRQYRGALDATVLEIPAGKLDVPGEDVEDAARRELLEEAGCVASSFTGLGSFYNSPGFTDEFTTCFLAEGLTHLERAHHGIEEEHMTVETMSFEKLWKLQARGELTDGKSLLALFLAARVLAARSASS
ncbi:MAG TPA: NUDIX hydrolase [Acidimicrobiales bacterium]|jgi:ADP-ribose pyrophosphatase|nr:NUDIX hydrolase [Acidimicrobiales bacterium]